MWMVQRHPEDGGGHVLPFARRGGLPTTNADVDMDVEVAFVGEIRLMAIAPTTTCWCAAGLPRIALVHGAEHLNVSDTQRLLTIPSDHFCDW